MVIISAVFSLTDVIVKATQLLSRVPGNWYGGGSDSEKFKSILSDLSRRSSQWERQLTQNGTSESPVYKTLHAEAVRLLDAEMDHYEKKRKSRAWKFRRRPFPSQLTYVLSNILQLVQAGLNDLAKGAERHELLTKGFLMEPLPLPFGFDLRYVPLQETVKKLQGALEKTEGRQVVTLFGAPGSGKSSLAKYIALLYQDSVQRSTSCSFDGVQYLHCGQGCSRKVFELQKAFSLNLGIGVMLGACEEGADHNSSLYQSLLRRALGGRRMLIILDDVWTEDFEVLTKLISQGIPCKYLLTSQTRDVWPEALCIQMGKPTEGEAGNIFHNYLEGALSSIHPRMPSSSNHLQGASAENQAHEFFTRNRPHASSSREETPPSQALAVQWIVSDIITGLERHPLSLVNVAVSINSTRTTNSDNWEYLTENLFAFLDTTNSIGRILVYERAYSHRVSDRMMLMVEGLREAERNLLFLIALLNSSSNWGIPEHLLRFFTRRVWEGSPSQSTFKYISALNYLESNSLVQLDTSERDSTNSSTFSVGLKTHNLRREVIRRSRLPALQNLASSLVGPRGHHHHGGESPVDVGDGEQCLAVVFAAAYFDYAFLDEIALPFQSLMMQMNGDGVPGELERQLHPHRMSRGLVPHDLDQLADGRELLKSTKHLHRKLRIFPAMGMLTELLSLEGEELWKKQVYSAASKVIMKVLCKHQLDDESMASLLTISYTTDAACRIFSLMYEGLYRKNLEHSFYYGHRKALSHSLPATWRTLLNLLHSKKLRLSDHNDGSTSRVMGQTLNFESDSAVLGELQKLCELADQSPDPCFQNAVHRGFLNLHGLRLSFGMLDGLDLQGCLPTFLWKLIRDQDGMVPEETMDMYRRAMECVRRDRGYVKALLTFPIPCEEWLTDVPLLRRMLRMEENFVRDEPLLLAVLSGTSEFQAEAARVLARGECWDRGSEDDFTIWPESYGTGLARFWGNVALLPDLHDTTRLRLGKIAKDWVIELSECNNGGISCRSCSCERSIPGGLNKRRISSVSVADVTRSVTIIGHHQVSLKSASPWGGSALEGSKQDWMDSTCLRCKPDRWYFFVQACWGQAHAYHQMEEYAEALVYLELAQEACDICPGSDTSVGPIRDCIQGDLRLHRVLIQSLMKDYEGAMDSLHQYEQDLSLWVVNRNDVLFTLFSCRAVLFKSLEKFSRAIEDFDYALRCWKKLTFARDYLEHNPRVHNYLECCLLEHRGQAKRLMGDVEGSKLDMELARGLRISRLVLEPVSWEFVNYTWPLFGEASIRYLLLQLLISH